MSSFLVRLNLEKINEYKLNLYQEELDSVCNGYVFMDKIIDKAKKLTLSFDAALPYNREELLKQSYYELGEAQGIEQNNMQTAIKMLKENIDVNTIAKITGLSAKQIKDLEKITIEFIVFFLSKM